MTVVLDFFGTDDFWSNESNPYSKIQQEANWFENNVWDEIDEPITVWTWDQEYVPQVDDNVTCEDPGGRLVEANDWLRFNFTYYNDTDGCIVLDHYWDNNYFGCAFIDGATTSDEKTCLVDYGVPSYELKPYDQNGIGIQHYLGMEPGHLYGARHPDDSLINQLNQVTFMFNDEGANCGSYGSSADEAIASFSTCAEDVINSTANNV